MSAAQPGVSIHHLSIDIETYSSVDITKAGLYAYVQAPDFQILLFAYSFDGYPVEIVDLAQGEVLPKLVVDALQSPYVIKHAYNAPFEWYCLNKFYSSPLNQWRCTMLHGLYCGYTAGLAATAVALGLPEDKRKLGIGKALIRTFCVPTKPSKANGMRTRTLPRHEPEKWQLFKEYCRQDVYVEMEIERKLAAFPVPDSEQLLWQLDQQINACGVAVDKELIAGALHCSQVSTEALLQEAVALSGLANPKSVQQLTKWFEKETGEEIADLQKGTVKVLVETLPEGKARRMLELRRELAKTSVKKYAAMDAAVCADGRVRGLLQFYGANRTGRWAGRLVQVQNLPRNYLETLDVARKLVKHGKVEALQIIYGSVADTLSQLIRTAFIPSSGHSFVVADFSAIEARVIAWLAGEEWRQDVFATHGKIYEASASQMFGVPIERIKKGNPEYALRQKGKIAELACVAAGQKVLTDQGFVNIENVTCDMKIWDGIEFVDHEGVLYKGVKEVIYHDGLAATKDHLVWVEGKERPIRFENAAASGAHLLQLGSIWTNTRNCTNYRQHTAVGPKMERPLCINNLSRVQKHSMDALLQFGARKIKRVSALLTAACHSKMVGKTIHRRAAKMHKPQRRKLSKLRRQRDQILFRFANSSGTLDDRKLWIARQRNGAGSYRCKRELRTGKSALGDASRELCKSAKVYDILNCGPRNRYTVNGRLVHNCGYQGSVGALKAMGADKMGLSDDELLKIIQRWRAANPRIVELWYRCEKAALAALKTGQPVGVAQGLIFAHEGDYRTGQDFLTVRLPSGRRLFYVQPFLQVNEKGREALHYRGVSQTTKKWETIATYGGKLVENITQAIARDCLAESLLRLAQAGYQTVMHVHDEAILDVPEDKVDLEKVCAIMGAQIAWAPGLRLRADGFVTGYYKKD